MTCTKTIHIDCKMCLRRLLRFAVVIVLLCDFHIVDVADAAITFEGPKCGNRICRLDEYCSRHNTECEKCIDICDDTHHNVDKILCTKECQDYLHDVRYTSSKGSTEELSRVQKQLNLVVILLIVVLLVLALNNCIHLAKWCKGRGIVTRMLRKLKLKKPSSSSSGKMPPQDITHANPNTQSPKFQLRNAPLRTQQNQINRESTVFSIDGASTIQTVSTPISTRYPAEDSTLSYSYDNAALAITPTIPERPRNDPPVF